MIRALAILAALGLTSAAHAGPDDFSYGPVFDSYGRVADVPDAESLPADTVLRVAFDISDAAEPGEVSRRIDSAARFINMHARAGLEPMNVEVAIVLHGRAAWDVTNADWYAAHQDGAVNANADLVAQLIDLGGVRFFVCGQTAAYYDITAEDLLPGVQMSLSAMTAHALLQQDGYTLNPF